MFGIISSFKYSYPLRSWYMSLANSSSSSFILLHHSTISFKYSICYIPWQRKNHYIFLHYNNQQLLLYLDVIADLTKGLRSLCDLHFFHFSYHILLYISMRTLYHLLCFLLKRLDFVYFIQNLWFFHNYKVHHLQLLFRD